MQLSDHVFGLVLLTLLSAGCRGTGRENLTRIGNEFREVVEGPDEDCEKPRNIDPQLEGFLTDYVADAQKYGANYYPLGRLGEIRTLTLVPLGADALQGDRQRM